MARPHIVIVTFCWPPRNAIGTHRPYSWAKYWAQEGLNVTVLTAKKYSYDMPLDLCLPELKGVSVFEVPYSGSYAWVANQVSTKRIHRAARTAYSFVRKRVGRSINPRRAWRRAALSYARHLADECDIVVSTFDPPESHLIAYDIKCTRPEIVWIADYRDLWSVRSRRTWTGSIRHTANPIERRTVGLKADGLTTVSNGLAADLEHLGISDIGVIENGFDEDEERVRQRIRMRRRKIKMPLEIVYTGKIYSGHRDPTPLLEALAQMNELRELNNSDVVVRFYGVTSEESAKIGLTARLRQFARFEGYVSRTQALQLQREADVLLLMERGSPEGDGILTGKLFEYIAAGRPILSIGSSRSSELATVLRRTGTGVTAEGDVTRIKAIISDLVEKAMADWFEPVEQQVLRYSRREQARRMHDFLIKVWQRNERNDVE